MAQDTAAVSGPDLAAGVPLSSVPTQGVLAGHVDGTPVLVARLPDGYFAVSATCSHYGGPLALGRVDGDEIRCPWHHACFSLRTGAALHAPAFAALDRWQVEVVDAQLFVRGQAPAASAPPPATASAHPRRIVIVGGGAAGFAAAQRLRASGFAGTLTMLSADSAPPCDRPNLSKDYLAGTAPEDWIPLQGPRFYAKHHIDLHLDCQVARIDAAARCVVTQAGDRHEYDALLIATGAEPVRLPLPGFDLPNVFALRTLDDSRAIIAAAEGSKRVALVGGGFIGLEAAAALRARGLDVHVIARDALPMAKVLGPQLARSLVELHRQHGVVFHLEATTQGFDGRTLTLADGTRIDADLVIVGVGVVARTQLAAAAGIEVDDGIAVDAHLQTSIPGIYAAGDVARFDHGGQRFRIEHWVHALRQGQAAAANLLGAAQPFTDVPFFWTHHYDLELRYTGYGQVWDEVVVDGVPEDRDCIARFFHEGRLVAAASIGRDLENLAIEAELRR